MNNIHVRFVSEVADDEVEELKEGRPVISKLILSPDDYRLFHYREGDAIEAETQHGNRLWCKIRYLEVITDQQRVILIFTLVREALQRVH